MVTPGPAYLKGTTGADSAATGSTTPANSANASPSAGVPTQEKTEAASRNTIAAAPRRGHAIDANGNAAVGVVISIKTGTKARVGISYAARFQAYIDDLENNYGARAVHERHPAGALFASK
jgi:hypothetical protein